MVKNLPASTGDPGLIPGSGRSPGEGNGEEFGGGLMAFGAEEV